MKTPCCQICHDCPCVITEHAYCEECRQLLRWFRGYLDMPDSSTVNDTTTFLDLGVDSLDYMCWLHEAKEHFDVEITDREAERMRTVGDYLCLLRSRGAKWDPKKTIQLKKSGRICTFYSWSVTENKPVPYEECQNNRCDN